jgi:glycosyltransferase involved in cell wall biosynthesis
MASHHEGFSTSMLEALACGKPIVSTAVSSATTIVDDGQTGCIVGSREPRDFAQALGRALALDAVAVRSRCAHRMGDYATANVRDDLCRDWPALRTA